MRPHNRASTVITLVVSTLIAGLPACLFDAQNVEMTESPELGPNLACIDEAVSTVPAEVSGRFMVLDHWREQWTCDLQWNADGDCQLDPAIAGAQVYACGLGDYACAQPMDQQRAGADGTVVVDLSVGERGWDGYVEVDAGEGYFGGIFVSVPGKLPETMRRERLAMQPTTLTTLFEQASGFRVPVDRGILLAVIEDCAGQPLEGVSIEINTAADVGYEVAGAPDFERSATTTTGAAWAFDIAPGLHTVVTRDVATGVALATARLVPFKPGVVTRLVMAPTR